MINEQTMYCEGMSARLAGRSEIIMGRAKEYVDQGMERSLGR